MTTSWRVGVWIDGIDNSGSEVVEVASTDTVAQATPPAAGALRLVAPLRLAETIGDELWPAQPITTATVQVLANTAAELAMIRKGVQACVAFKVPGTAAGSGNVWDWRFGCVVQSCTLRPHPSGGVVATVAMVDHLVGRLSQQDTGTAAWPAETIPARIDRLLGANGTPGAWYGPSPTPATTPNVAARAASRTSVLDLVTYYLREWVDTDGVSAGAIGVVGRPFLVPDLLDSSAWDIDGVFFQQWVAWRLNKSADLSQNYTDPEGVSRPLRFDLDPGLVDFPGEWSNGNDQPTQVSATWSNAGVEATNTKTSTEYADRPITATIETDLTVSVSANRVAALYLPDNGATQWVASTFRYRLSDAAAATTIPRLGQVVILDGIHPAHTPDGSGLYFGRLVESELTVEGGQAYMDLTLRPMVTEFLSGASSRWYFVDTAPSLSPAYGSMWEGISAASRGTLSTTKPVSGTTTGSVSVIESVAGNPRDELLRQYVSDPFSVSGVLPAGAAWRAVVAGVENAAAADAMLAVVIRVVDETGAEQAVLYEPTSTTVVATSGANNQELPTTTAATRLKDATTTTRVTVEAGWRLVVEVGVRFVNSVTTSYIGTLRLGSTAASDHAFAAGVTTDLSPWLEFTDRDVVP